MSPDHIWIYMVFEKNPDLCGRKSVKKMLTIPFSFVSFSYTWVFMQKTNKDKGSFYFTVNRPVEFGYIKTFKWNCNCSWIIRITSTSAAELSVTFNWNNIKNILAHYYLNLGLLDGNSQKGTKGEQHLWGFMLCNHWQ